MFDRYKKIKYIGIAVLIVFIAVFMFANVRFKSVNAHRAEQESLRTEQENLRAEQESLRAEQESLRTEQENLRAEQESPGTEQESLRAEQESLRTEQESPGAEQESPGTEQESPAAEQESLRTEQESLRAEQESLEDEQQSLAGPADETQGTTVQEQTTETERPSQKIITCTIEIRCDAATAKKDSVTNPGVAAMIPDNGVILQQMTYSGYDGMTVYDVLSNAAHMKDIALVSNADQSYVSSIGGLSEKMLGQGSGWTYRVNGDFANVAANAYKVKDNDRILWRYVTNPSD